MTVITAVLVLLAVPALRWLAVEGARRRAVRRIEIDRTERTVAIRRRATRRLRRRQTDVDRRLAMFADAVARELRTGATLAHAVVAAGPVAGGGIAEDIAEVARRVDAGTDLRSSLERWAGERSSPLIDQVVAVVSLGLEVGGELAGAFELVADALRDRQALDDEIASLTSQSRASGALLSGLPPIAAAGLAAIDPATGRFLVGSLTGVAIVVAAVVLDAAGWWWMRALAGGVR